MKDIITTGPDGTDIIVKPLARLTCPFCNHEKNFTIGYMNGDAESGLPAVLHDEFPCEAFVEKGLLEYLRAARHAGARPVKEPN